MIVNGAMEDSDSDSGSELEAEVTEDGGGNDAEPAPRRTRTEEDGSPAPSRKERRKNEMARAEEARLAAEARAQEYQNRLDRQEQQIAEMRGYLAAQHQRQQQDPNATVDKRIEALDDEAHDLLERAAALNGAGDRAGARAALKKREATLREAQYIYNQSKAAPEIQKQFDDMRSSMPDPQVQATYNQAVSEFPWLTTDEDAASLVNAKLGQLLKAGRPRTIATIREAATAVAKRMGIGGRTPPSTQQRQRFAGVSAGESGAGEGGGRQMPEDNRTNRTLAQKSYPALEPKKAWAAWTRMVMESEDDE